MKIGKSNKDKIKTNKLLEPNSDDVIDKVCNKIVIDISDNHTDITKVEQLNKENI